jgi:RNA polymerase sigma factor (sigma-70 family)
MDQRLLLAAAQAGDERAFRQLVEPYRHALEVHCYRMLGSAPDAEDLAQETLLRAWRALERFEPRAQFQTWLYRIATNACLDELERRPRRPAPVDPFPDRPSDDLAAPTYDPAAAAAQHCRALRSAAVTPAPRPPNGSSPPTPRTRPRAPVWTSRLPLYCPRSRRSPTSVVRRSRPTQRAAASPSSNTSSNSASHSPRRAPAPPSSSS